MVAYYRPTPKNALAKNFLPEQGFEKRAEGRYQRNLYKDPPQPESAFPVALELEFNWANSVAKLSA